MVCIISPLGLCWQHSGAVVNTVTSQQQGPEFKSWVDLPPTVGRCEAGEPGEPGENPCKTQGEHENSTQTRPDPGLKYYKVRSIHIDKSIYKSTGK